ncbi:MAG: hypothetical protein EB127_08970 [Alphaproteobacteria bacterium]|nr:hypothetical protein [Alphaproteobacteria bacterium]
MKEMSIDQMYILKSEYLEITPQNEVESSIHEECTRISNFLIKKNRAYGNSALDPVRIFSRADRTEQLKVRIDDKLSRFVRGHEYLGDNDIDDLMGYLVLLKIAIKEDGE